MPSDPIANYSTVSPSVEKRVDQVCMRFETAWRAGQAPRIEDYLADIQEPERCIRLHELLLLDIHYRRKAGECLEPEDYLARFPELEVAGLTRALQPPATTAAQPPSTTKSAASSSRPPGMQAR